MIEGQNMPIMLEQKELYALVKNAVKETLAEEFAKELRPRLEQIDELMHEIEDALLNEIALKRLSEIEDGAETIPLEVMERKYAIQKELT